jgi:hypothetical protein
MAETDLTAMDLRGFSPQHEGCLFEIQMLIDTVPIERMVLLVDYSTDLPFLRDTLEKCWLQMTPLSPNASADSARLRILDVSGRELNAVRRLMQIGDEVIAAQTLILGEDIQSHW